MRTLISIASFFLFSAALLSDTAIENEGVVLFSTQCTGCHQLGHNAYGPNLCGLSGRTAGTAQGYSYSNSMKNSGIVWNRESLERFLLSPQTLVPGTRMGIIGFEDRKQREAIATYVLQVSKSSVCF